jgi:adenylate kinase family enzyme
MQELERIHTFGAAGCRSSTLGWALARRLAYQHLDSDDFHWVATTPPFQTKRPTPERLRLLAEATRCSPQWVLSGSIAGWGDALIPSFDLVVFLYVPTEIRLARLQQRERARFGTALDPDGAMHDQHQAFLRWAAGYDAGLSGGRTLWADATWLAYLPCPVMCLIGESGTAEQVSRVLAFWQTQAHEPLSSRHTTAEVFAMIQDSIAYFRWKTFDSTCSRDNPT